VAGLNTQSAKCNTPFCDEVKTKELCVCAYTQTHPIKHFNVVDRSVHHSITSQNITVSSERFVDNKSMLTYADVR
jgi:hypothetical protein